jgi:hypothetical protein
MEYDVYAYHVVSDDGSCNSGCNYRHNDRVRTVAVSVPYENETVVSVSAEAVTHEYGGTQSHTTVSACAKVDVWVGADQDDSGWTTGTF